jgi:hypothetical protein
MHYWKIQICILENSNEILEKEIWDNYQFYLLVKRTHYFKSESGTILGDQFHSSSHSWEIDGDDFYTSRHTSLVFLDLGGVVGSCFGWGRGSIHSPNYSSLPCTA